MKILIVDDDLTTRLSLVGLLKQHDCEIVEADSGKSALSIIQSNNPPDLIIMDWSMPGLSGVEVTTLVRETVTEEQPYVIIVSSYKQDEQVIEALNYGADDYITKPVDGLLLKAKFAVAKRIIDIQEKLRQSNEMLEKLAYHDELTGVLNRRAGTASFQVELNRAIRKSDNLAVALVDIDHFKNINDSYGHPGGDEVLRVFAATLQKTMRPYDIVCRYGGEEFLLIAQVGSAQTASELFERVRQTISQTAISYEKQTINITASFGVHVVTPDYDLHLKQMTKQADENLYKAKADGRNRVIVSADVDNRD
jgi:diguanylate cyclase (GGDEF)-like protein